MPETPTPITVKDAAAVLGMHPEYVRELCRTGKLVAARSGSGSRSAFVIRREDLDRFCAEQEARRRMAHSDEFDEPLSEADLIRMMEKSARAGSVRARTWLLERQWPERWAPSSARAKGKVSEDDIEPADPFQALDELAARREAAG